MKTIRIAAHEFANDVKAGAGDALLLKKYGLSVAGLLKVKKELVAKGLLSVDDVGTLQTVGASPLDLIDESSFLESFCKEPDDYHLMAKYSLTPDRLKKLYKMLIRKGLLSEYEFNTRTGKAPEIDGEDYPKHDDTSSVTWKTEPIEVTGYSTEIRNFMLSLAEDDGSYVRSTDRSKKRELQQSDTPVRAASVAESCPKCGHPKDPAMPDSCARCGVVYAKLRTSTVAGKISVWDDEFRVR